VYKFLQGLFLGIILATCFSLYADKISAPPPLAGEPVAEQLYFQELYTNFHRLEVVSVIPDTVRQGKKGDMVLYISGVTYRLYLNVDSSTSWKYATLS
jgi:hypothetical protein